MKSNYSLCFYVPTSDMRGMPTMIDVARTNDKGEAVTYFDGETLAQLRKRYPTAQLALIEQFIALKEAILRSAPEPTTQEAFIDALEVLPPLDWHRNRLGESFKMVERYSGRMTTIYARLGTSYWCFMDADTLTHDEIMARVQEVSHG